MRALVTGSAGFIGSTLVDRLLADGHEVVGVDNLSTGSLRNLKHARRLHESGVGRFTSICADVQAPELAETIADANPEVVFHLAAQASVGMSVTGPLYDARVNILGTINLLEACSSAGVSKIVYAASGGSRYGSPAKVPVNEDSAVDPQSPYAAAKLACEFYIGAYAAMYGLTTICLALADVYGPRQDPYGEAGVVAAYGESMLAGRAVTIYGDGSAAGEYVYVDDVVDAFVRAGRAPASTTGVFNIGTGRQTTLAELHRIIGDKCGTAAPPRYAPARASEPLAMVLDSARAASALGWAPTVDIIEGVHRTVDWLRTADSASPAPATLLGV